MDLREACRAARLDDEAADDLALREGMPGVSPPRPLRLGAIPIGAAVLLPGVLTLLAPGALESWPTLASGVVLVVAGAGLSVSRPWGPLLASLGCASLALRATVQVVEGGGGEAVALYALVLCLVAAGFALLRERRLRAVLGRVAPPEIRATWRVARRREGPAAWRACVAVGAVYVAFVAIVFVTHRLRGIDAPLGLGVQGAGLSALTVRTSFYVLSVVAALWAVRGVRASPTAAPDLARDLGRGVLLFLGAFAVLSALGSLLDLFATFRGSAAGAVASSFRAGLEEETARATTGFDAVRFLYVAALAPVGEEMLFRWALYRGLRTHMPAIAAALVQALVFALLHHYRFAAYQALLVGLASAWMVERTRRILPSIVAHGLWNGLQSL